MVLAHEVDLPDVEALVYSLVKPLGGVTCWRYALNDGYSPRAAQVPEWVKVHSLQVDARAGRKTDALRRAQQARLLMLSLPGRDWPGGVVNRVLTTDGPFWLPDSDNGGPRYVARYDVWAHPRVTA